VSGTEREHADRAPTPADGGTYLAVWPVEPDMTWPAARRAAGEDLRRLAELAGVTLTGPVRFIVCAAQHWHGPLGTPGDLLLVALAPAQTASAAGRGPTPPGCSAAAEYLPADVTARERGRRERQARLDALAQLRRAGYTAALLTVEEGVSSYVKQLIDESRDEKAAGGG